MANNKVTINLTNNDRDLLDGCKLVLSQEGKETNVYYVSKENKEYLLFFVHNEVVPSAAISAIKCLLRQEIEHHETTIYNAREKLRRIIADCEFGYPLSTEAEDIFIHGLCKPLVLAVDILDDNYEVVIKKTTSEPKESMWRLDWLQQIYDAVREYESMYCREDD